MLQTFRYCQMGSLILFTSLGLHAAKIEKPSTEIDSGAFKASSRAIHYELPKNYFDFAFKLKTTTKKQGPYCDVARYFFEPPPKFDCNHPTPAFDVSLIDQIGVSERAQPDQSAGFDLTVKSGTFTETNLTMGFGDPNILTGAQSSITDHKVDFFISIFKTLASAATNVIPLALKAAPPPPLSAVKKNPTTPDAADEKKKREDLLASCVNGLDESQRPLLNRLGPLHKALACGLDGELQAAYLAVPDQYKAYVDAYQRDGYHFDEHFADALALFVEYSGLTADESRFLHPERLPANADAFSAVLKAREDKKKAIREQFFGSSAESIQDVPPITWRFGGPEKEVELFSLDTATEGGLCFRTASEERWVARPIGVDACETTSQSLVSVYAILHQKQQMIGDVAPTNAGNEQAGVAYRIPGRATLRVFARKVDSTEYDYFSTDFDIAQFGTVKFLPALFGSSSSYNVALDPVTGALKNVTIGVKPVLSGDSAKSLDDLSGSLLGVVDAVNAAKKKPTALDSAQTEGQLKLEQLRIQLIDLCKTDPTQSFCATLLK
jgi:hypothetical protein